MKQVQEMTIEGLSDDGVWQRGKCIEAFVKAIGHDNGDNYEHARVLFYAPVETVHIGDTVRITIEWGEDV